MLNTQYATRNTIMIDTTAYLQRIHYTGRLEPTADTLDALQQAHLLAVPFENLDIHLGRPIILDHDSLFDKIVRQRRGGFCYELNGLFAILLQQLGFDVTLLSARVTTADGGFGPEYDHLALLVQLEERWLVDVGFGDSFHRPLRLDEPGEQEDGRRAYRLDFDGTNYTLYQRDGLAAWQPQYIFSGRPRRFGEFDEMCLYHQTSPDSPFPNKRLCTQATVDGRITVSNQRLIISQNGARQEQELPDKAAFTAALQHYFGIDIAL
jgi:N-hydroxyarylamine O-acetyltransferase